MSVLRDYLASELQSKIDRYGIVIWDDHERSYEDMVGDVVGQTSASLATLQGSWYQLRHQIEPQLAGVAPPALVLYLNQPSPDPDPLEELRAVGSRFRVLLPTLLKNALEGQATSQRISELAQQCTTAAEVDAVLQRGGDAVDARLITITGESTTPAILAAVLSAAPDRISGEIAAIVADFATGAVGGQFAGLEGDDLQNALFRQLVLVELAAELGGVPETIGVQVSPPSAAQTHHARDTRERLRSTGAGREVYDALAQASDDRLRLAVTLGWVDGLTKIDLTPAIEQLALSEGFRRLADQEFGEAGSLARQRLDTSYWARPSTTGLSARRTRWQAVEALARLQTLLSAPPPRFDRLADVVTWYADDGWMVDAAYRQCELLRTSTGLALEEFDDLFAGARRRYETWLDGTITATTAALAEPSLPTSAYQRSVHERFVRRAEGRCAYVLVDALRYELAIDLARRLGTVPAVVSLEPVVATPPTITNVGMAAVLPGAQESFAVVLDEAGRLEARVRGDRIATVQDRVAALAAVHGRVEDLPLDRVAQSTNKELASRIKGADLVLVRSTELDSDGESDQLATSWGAFDNILNVLQTAVARLLYAGIERVVITADHGFLAVRQLGEERRIDRPPTGVGQLHRRAWIGRGGTVSDSTAKIPLSTFGVTSDLDVIVPRGLGVFSAGGGLQFFHGGLSPQELVVPVLTVRSQQTSSQPSYQISVSVAGGSITTGVVAVTITMTGDLFTRESLIRLQLSRSGQRLGRVVGGDGVDLRTDTIDATVDDARVVTMQLTSNVTAGEQVQLDVLDASTGLPLIQPVDIDVAANVFVEDELD